MIVSTRSSVKNWIKGPLQSARALLYIGKGRLCPICQQTSRQFLRMGRENREDAQCPHCLSTERHRFSLLYFLRKTNLFDDTSKKVLHVSPAECLETALKTKLGDSYLTADLFRPSAMVKMDITNIQYPDQSFDVVLCSHVLEHVDDDIKAMREFYRVMKDDGWAILLVPITSDKTFEDPSIVDPIERLEAFGELDHVRRYGLDYIDRLHEAGFKVELASVNDVASSDEIELMGLTPASGDIYLCTK